MPMQQYQKHEVQRALGWWTNGDTEDGMARDDGSSASFPHTVPHASLLFGSSWVITFCNKPAI